jgi:hypothetical protein
MIDSIFLINKQFDQFGKSIETLGRQMLELEEEIKLSLGKAVNKDMLRLINQNSKSKEILYGIGKSLKKYYDNNLKV